MPRLTYRFTVRFVTVALMLTVRLRYTMRTKTEMRTFEREAEFAELPAIGDSIDAFPPAVEPYDVIRIEVDVEPGPPVVVLQHWDPEPPVIVLQHWDPEPPEDHPVDWNNPVTRADLKDLVEQILRKGRS